MPNMVTHPDSIAFFSQLKWQSVKVQWSSHQQWTVSTALAHQGQGVPMLLLHGFDSSLLEFRQLLPRLAAQGSAWAIDLLGFGFTQTPADMPITPAAIRSHLYAVWHTLIKQPVLLVGASMGGATAIDFALHYPQSVRGLVLMNSLGFSGSFPIGQLLVSPLLDWSVNWLKFRKQMALTLLSLSPNRDADLINAVRCALLHQENPGWHRSLAAFTRSGGYSDLAPQISQIQAPTLILWGKQDDLIGTRDAHRFHEAIVHSRLTGLDCGHAPHLEQPHLVAQHILQFHTSLLDRVES